MKIGFFPMVADILHPGHLIAIEEAKQNCDYLIIGLFCHPSYKHPVQTIYERFMQLRSVKWVDEIIPYEDEEDVKKLMRSLKFDVYFLGEDYSGKNFAGKEILIDLQKEIHYLSRKHDFGSTMIKQRVVDNPLDKIQS